MDPTHVVVPAPQHCVSTQPLTCTPLLLHTSSPCAHTLHTRAYTHPTHVLVSPVFPSRRRIHTHCHAHTPPRHLLTPSGSGTPSHATNMLIHTQASQDADVLHTFTPLEPLFTAPPQTHPKLRCCASLHKCVVSAHAHLCARPWVPHTCVNACTRLPQALVYTLPRLLPFPLLCVLSSTLPHHTLTASRS